MSVQCTFSLPQFLHPSSLCPELPELMLGGIRVWWATRVSDPECPVPCRLACCKLLLSISSRGSGETPGVGAGLWAATGLSWGSALAGEEGRLVQGKMDSLQLRLLLVDQRSSDTLQKMEQILEASSHLDPAQEDLGLGLQPLEKEQLLPGSQAGDGSCPLVPAGGEKVGGR